jgi:hypothetical protein
MDDSSYRRNFDLDKEHLEMSNIAKFGYELLYIALYIFAALHMGKITIFEPKVIQIYIENLFTSQGYIFFILQHLAI